MTYEIRQRMQKEMDRIKLRISELENMLRLIKNRNTIEYRKLLKELERSYKEKGEFEVALRIIGQYER